MPTVLDNVDIILAICDCKDLLLQKRYNEALKICDRAVDSKQWSQATSETQVFVLVLRGMVHQLLKNNAKALDDLAAALKLNPNHTAALKFQASSFSAEGKLEEAIKCYDSLESSQTPLKKDFYVNRAGVLLRAQQYKGALAAAKIALELEPTSEPALINASLAAEALHDFNLFGSYTEELLRLNPASQIGKYLRAKSLLHANDNEQALAFINQTVDSNYLLDGLAYHTRIAILKALKKYEEGLEDCEKWLKFGKNSVLALASKGDLLRQMKRNDEAIEVLKQAVQIAADVPAKISAHSVLCITYLKLGDTNAAFNECAAMLQLEPDNATALNNRAWIFAHQGKFEAALDEIQLVFKLPRVSSNERSTRGFIYFLLGMIDEAVNDFDHALSQNPRIGEALFYRAVIYRRQGDAAKAREFFDRAVEVDFELPVFSQLTLPDGLDEKGNVLAP